tara:strand:+ start:174 stop:482 length:309 start_codon:yes stop_codon:yes gene_type:complete
MSISKQFKNESNLFIIDIRLFYLLLLLLLVSFSIFYTIHIKNKNYDLTTNQIPLILKKINTLQDFKIAEQANKDRLLRSHIKNEAKNLGMIKANYSKDIIKW